VSIATHGIDTFFLIVAAIAFLIGTIVALALIEPRPAKWLSASVPFGLLFLTLAALITG
jgi:hypothetical protein